MTQSEEGQDQLMNERVAVLEVQVKQLAESLDKFDKKLDDLIELKSKGVGAFWLASALLGTGIVTFIVSIFEWFKGVH